MHEHPGARLINGNTEVGIEVRFKAAIYPVFIFPSDVSELKSLEIKSNGVSFGGCMTIANFQKHMLGFVDPATSKFKPYQVRGFEALLENVKWFAGHQIRNVAAIAGNIVTASPISDLNPIFVAMVYFTLV
jgi:xanthine dehydrogenase/oxidase